MTSPGANDPRPIARTEQSSEVAEIVEGYTFDEPAIELGVLIANNGPDSIGGCCIPLAMLNRHGLVAGATGPGRRRPCS